MCSMDTTLSSFISRITEVEEQVSRLEDMQASKNDNPAATKTDIQLLTDRLAAENRSRRNNRRFVGIPEGAEKNNTTAFLDEFISVSLGTDLTLGSIKMDCGHRIGEHLVVVDKCNSRMVVARFLRYKDCQNIIEAAREKKWLTWNGKRVRIFPDFSEETQRTREAFSRIFILETWRLFSLTYGM